MERSIRSLPFTPVLRQIDNLLWIAVLVCGALAAAAWAKYLNDRAVMHAVSAAALAAASATYILCSLCGSRSMKLRVLTGTVSTCLALYVAEGLLVFSDASLTLQDLRIREARRLGVAFDTRRRIDVVHDIRKAGDDCYAAVVPAFLREENRLLIRGGHVLPLAGVPQATFVLGNETGEYAIFRSDEFGFNGPSGIWPSREPITVAFIGDSFTQGAYVPGGKSFADLVRRIYPRTVNLASVGNGPLLELATIREYLRDRRVETIFWVYYEGNDLVELASETADPILSRYLRDPDYSQKLVEKQALITAGLRSYLLGSESRDASRARSRGWQRLWRHATLSNWREATWSVWDQVFPSAAATFDLSLFRAVLQSARRAAAQSRARLVLVYLPEFGRYKKGGSSSWSGKRYKDQVLAIARSLAIDCVDIEPLFAMHPSPQSLFPFGLFGHYTPEGHAIVARAILEHLDGAARGHQSTRLDN